MRPARAPKRKMLRRSPTKSGARVASDEVDRFLLWLTELGDLQLATRAQNRA